MPRAESLMVEELTETAFAKVNLALHVRERRADGYHALESLFVFAEHGDRLSGRIAEDGEIGLWIGGRFGHLLDPGADNLVTRAAHALQAHLGERRGATLDLTKDLPVASGIGGGSADAAATLRLLLRLWDARIAPEALEQIALELGSDVPACLASVTQIVRGRGELLEQRAVQGLAGMPMLLVNPGVGLSTARIFAGWDGVDRGPLRGESLGEVIADGRNDLEPAAIAIAPVIAEVLSALRCQSGASLSRMSGSGATCFALFEDEGGMMAAARAIRAVHPDWWVQETRIRSE